MKSDLSKPGGRRVSRMAAGLMLAVLLPVSVATAATRDQVQRMVEEEARANPAVPEALALAVARVESDFRDDALSSAGARGVMQIMPDTARAEVGVSADRLWDARTNIRLGIDYLARLHRQYGGRWELALSHYNGGTLKGVGAAAEPHSYTRDYVRKVLGWQGRYARRPVEVQLARVAGPKRVVSVPEDYWMVDDRGSDRGWRDYLRVADYWVAAGRGALPEEGEIEHEEERPRPVVGSGRGVGVLGRNRMVEESDRLRLRFRSALAAEERARGGWRDDPVSAL